MKIVAGGLIDPPGCISLVKVMSESFGGMTGEALSTGMSGQAGKEVFSGSPEVGVVNIDMVKGIEVVDGGVFVAVEMPLQAVEEPVEVGGLIRGGGGQWICGGEGWCEGWHRASPFVCLIMCGIKEGQMAVFAAFGRKAAKGLQRPPSGEKNS
jgi:hypothetical protein